MSLEQSVAENTNWINSVIAKSKLTSELVELAEIINPNEHVTIQEGINNAKFVSITKLRGFKGSWNAQTNTPTLVDGTGVSGDVYSVSVAFVRDLGDGQVTFSVDDLIYYNGLKWINLTGSSNYSDFASYTGTTAGGDLVLTLGDYTTNPNAVKIIIDIANVLTTIDSALSVLGDTVLGVLDVSGIASFGVDSNFYGDIKAREGFKVYNNNTWIGTIEEGFGANLNNLVYISSGGNHNFLDDNGDYSSIRVNRLEVRNEDVGLTTLSRNGTVSGDVAIKLPDTPGTLALEGDIFEWAYYSGTKAGGDLTLILGNGSGTYIEILNDDDTIKIKASSSVGVVSSIFSFTSDGNNVAKFLAPTTGGDNVNLTLPTTSGTLALSDGPKYIIPFQLTVEDGDNVNLSDSAYNTAYMIELSWVGGTGAMDINLPLASSSVNRTFRFISNSGFIQGGGKSATINPSGTDTLDGSTSGFEINRPYEGVKIWSNGTEWFVIQQKV
mgnify:CR=1 FL=1|tara:strand:+ start:925 stop:2412 length:1488 start_codon:yes stop_codon:yes gene_type:complete